MNETLFVGKSGNGEWLTKRVSFTLSSTWLSNNGLLYSGTAPFDGFCCVQINNSGTIPSGGWNIIIMNETKHITQSASKSINGSYGAICPVQKDDAIYIYGTPNQNVTYAFYYSI